MAREIFRHEWRLLARNRATAAVALLYLLSLPLLSIDLLKSGSAHFFDEWQRFGIFVVLPMLFLGAQLAQRDESARFAEIFASLPVANGDLLLGRLGVGAAVVCCAAGAQAIAGAAMAIVQRLPFDLFLRAWAGVWPTSLLILICAVLAGYVIALIAGRRAALLFLGMYWLVPLFATAFFGSFSARMHVLRIFDMSGAWGIRPTDMWGVGPEAGLRVFRIMFLVAFAALCIVAALWTHERRRPSGLAPRWLAATSVILVAALVLATAGYGCIYNSRVLMAESRDPGPDSDTLSPFAVSSYDLRADLAGDQLRVDATLTLVNAGGLPEKTLLLTLRDTLTVSAADFDGTPVTVSRTGNYLSVQLPRAIAPGAGGVLNIAYAGPLRDWSVAVRSNNDTNLRFGIGDGYAYLPYAAAWYPVPGHLRCAPPGFPRNGMLPHAPADFRLTVTTGLAVTSNLPAAGRREFAGQGYRGIYLLAAPRLAQAVGDGYRFTHYTGPTKSATLNMDAVRRLVSDACAYLPVAVPRRIDLLALPEPYVSTELPPAPPGPDGTLTLAVSERWAGVTDVHPRAILDEALLKKVAAWTISDGAGMADDQIAGSLGLWLAVRLRAASLGQSYDQAMRTFAGERGKATAGGIIMALDERWRSGGEAAVREALRPFCENPDMQLSAFAELLRLGAVR